MGVEIDHYRRLAAIREQERDEYQQDLNGLIYELKMLHKESPLLYIDLKNQTLMHQDKYFHLKKVLEME